MTTTATRAMQHFVQNNFLDTIEDEKTNLDWLVANAPFNEADRDEYLDLLRRWQETFDWWMAGGDVARE